MEEKSSVTVELTIRGMHCVSCAQGIENHLKSLGLEDVAVDYSTSAAQFSLKDPHVLPQVVQEIRKLGYQPEWDSERTGKRAWLSTLEGKFLFSLIFTLPLFLHMFLPFAALHDPYVQLALCTPVFMLGFSHFGKSALGALRARSTNMDVLIVIGISAAFVYSLAGTLLNLGPDFLFYETSATIITIVLFGNLLETRAVRKTSSAIEELARLQPSSAKRIVSPEPFLQVLEIEARSIQPDDVLLVNSGDRLPADGEIVWGEASLDESIITGESVPVEKGVGAQVIGATLVNKGTIRIRATGVGRDSVLSNIIQLVKQAQRQRPPIQRLGDAVSGVFVPAVVVIAFATMFVSYGFLGVALGEALLRSIAVLVIACPCAMGLATPTAVMVGVGQAARHGILIRGGDTLELLARVRRVVFDKTGTLTTGRFKIEALRSISRDDGFTRSVLLGLELHSSHPIARSIVAELSGVSPIELSEVKELRGVGVTGKGLKGETFELRAMQPDDEVEADLILLQDGVIAATLLVRDEVKPEAAEVVRTMERAGIHSILLSGDSEKKCASVANQVGINEVHARKLPEQKLKSIRELETAGGVAFVGDGINDAPALAAARIGISLSTATQIAIQSARVILLNGNLSHLPEAIAISRSTLRIIKQNLFWAFFYNCLGIPLAAMGLLNPVFAALAMAFSDVIVIGNSLRLKGRAISVLR